MRHDPRPNFAIGRFEIERAIGQGGMAQVWLGRDRVAGRMAAVKIVPARAPDPEFKERLRREVRALAGLDHPLIAAVLDSGTVTADEREAAHQFGVGSPWFAMEFVPHGDLHRLPRQVPWGTLQPLLMDILDALAHAHARGVIHRDLKPGNVMLRIEGQRMRAVLTDFGIAELFEGTYDGSLDDQEKFTSLVGTPQFMAPEQFRGETDDIGPWTDLYALGCLAWSLALGRLPYESTNPVTLAVKHMNEPVPELPPNAPCPAGFEGWAHRLLAKLPEERFECAADAARALAALGTTIQSGAEQLPSEVKLGPRRNLLSTGEMPSQRFTEPTHPTLSVVLDLAQINAESGERRQHRPTLGPQHSAPIVPREWRGPSTARRVIDAAGPGLFGVRVLPLIGRDAECDRLWASLRSAQLGNSPRLCLIEGAAGGGKTRLCSWLVCRATELGAAYMLRARFRPVRERRSPMVEAVSRWFAGRPRGRRSLMEHIAGELNRLDPESDARSRNDLARRLCSVVESEGAEHLEAQEQHAAAISEWLALLSRRRPVIVWLDAVHWSDWGLNLAERLSSLPEGRLLIVASVQSGISDRGREMSALARLRQTVGVERIELGPLPARAVRQLLVDALGLTPSLANPLAAASRGQPLFALQTITDWLADDRLAPGPDGLRPVGAPPRIPRSWPELAGQRLGRLFQRRPDARAALQALEAAAVLGDAVDDTEWALLSPAPRSVRRAVEATLLDAGLARPGQAGWMFAYSFVREALAERARRAGHWAPLNRALASRIADPDPNDPRPPERQGRAWMEAGEPMRAAEAWLEAATRAMAAATYRHAVGLAARAERTLASGGLPLSDARRVRCLSLVAEAQRYAGRVEDARKTIDRLRTVPVAPDRPWPLAERARLEGQFAFFEGRGDDAFRYYDEAIAIFDRIDDVAGVARSLHGQGWALVSLGRFDAGRERFVRGKARATAAGFTIDAAWCQQGLAGVAVFGGRPGGAAAAEEARRQFEALDSQAGYGYARLLLGEAAWLENRMGDARRHLDAAVAVWRSAESNLIADGLSRRALLDWQMGEPARARDRYRDIISNYLGRMPRGRRDEPLLGLARCLLELGDIALARQTFDRALKLQRRSAFPTVSVRALCDDLAAAFQSRGDNHRASLALRHSARLWQSYDVYQARMRRGRADRQSGG